METDRDGVAALRAAAVVAQDAGDYTALEQHARAIVERCEANGDELGLAWGYYFAGAARFQRNDGSAAERAYRKSLDLFDALGDRFNAARVTLSLGAVALDINLDVDQARHLYDRAIPVVRESGDRRRLAICLGNLGEIARLEGHPRQATRHADEALSIFRELGNEPALAGWQLTNLAHYAALQRDYRTAVTRLREAYVQLAQQPIARWIAWYFDVWFILAAELERWETAASLLGFIDHYRDANMVPRMQAMFPWFSLPVERLAKRSRTAEHLYDLRVAGESLSLPQAQSLTETFEA